MSPGIALSTHVKSVMLVVAGKIDPVVNSCHAPRLYRALMGGKPSTQQNTRQGKQANTLAACCRGRALIETRHVPTLQTDFLPGTPGKMPGASTGYAQYLLTVHLH